MENNCKDILIVTGGSLNIKWAKEYIKQVKFDYVIAADSGLVYAHEMKLNIDMILGDYDSVDREIFDKYNYENGSGTNENGNAHRKIITYPSEKNYTDTELAMSAAIQSGAESITLIGATGTRLDHTMANIGILNMALDSHIKCWIVDENNKIYLTDSSIRIHKNEQYGKYISILPFGGMVEKITLEGFKYPLHEYDMQPGFGIGISNEISGETAQIILGKGTLIVFETKD